MARPIRTALLTALAAALALTALPAAAVTETDDTVGIVKEGVAPSNAEIAVRLSEVTELQDATQVVVARDDRFADALASGVLQGESPMLLVPSTGPIPPRVLGELARLAPSDVVILGGDQAVAPDVEAQIQDLGVQTERRAGASRFETAVEIAATDAPDATTAILARAFPSPGSVDDTQAFADTLGVGAWAAEEGWPVMLTETDRLTPTTRDYLVGSAVEDIKLIGGTAAISDGVEAELESLGFTVERIAGQDRFGTAVEIAGKRGADSAADVAQVLVVDSQFANAWAGGLAAAAYSAANDAPIVLTSGATVPPSTEAFLASGTNGESDTPITCVAFPAACEQARVQIGLPAAAVVSSDAPDGAGVAPGQTLTVTIDSGGRPVSDVIASGSCLDGPTSPGTSTTVTVTLSDPLPEISCELRIDFTIDTGAGFAQDGGLHQTEILTYTTFIPDPEGGLSLVPSGGPLDARQLASNLVGDDVQVFNATLTGGAEAAGLFAGGGDVLGFDQGIALSTGFVADLVGPNDTSGTSGSLGMPGDAQLTGLSGNDTFDASVLQFDFVADPSATTVAFDYVFGSEEYSEFVGSTFNDVFAFNVNGQNCAVVAGSPVSVNTINAETNAGSYRSNEAGEFDIELDGLTTTLTCAAPINPGGANTLRLAIADASDDILDSAVLIRAASFAVG
ncbi:choice-of-anchor L domain-containing protein [Euzebya sp.]|uniref:choice-of-anchor L domain-containing protein n=1 Tax=Euzebya sp. TaxID=1971409 RepID=UPI003517481E